MNFTADTCLKNGTCNQQCNQGRTCPRVARYTEQVISKTASTGHGAKVAHVGSVRPIHPHLHARDDAWLTTPGQLERSDDERTGRVDTMLELGAKIIIWLVGTVIFAILAIAFTVQYGDTIVNFIWQALQALGRVWT